MTIWLYYYNIIVYNMILIFKTFNFEKSFYCYCVMYYRHVISASSDSVIARLTVQPRNRNLPPGALRRSAEPSAPAQCGAPARRRAVPGSGGLCPAAQRAGQRRAARGSSPRGAARSRSRDYLSQLITSRSRWNISVLEAEHGLPLIHDILTVWVWNTINTWYINGVSLKHH